MPEGQDWQLLGSSENKDSGFLFFAIRTPSEEVTYGNVSLPKLGSFEKFHIVDTASQKTFSLDVQTIRKARESCGVEAVSSPLPAGTIGSRADALFFAQRDGFPLIIVSGTQSAELVEIKGNDAATCLGSLLFPEPVESWAVTEDGAHLLGTAKGVGLRWSLRPSLPERARLLARDETAEGALVSSACTSDLAALVRKLEPHDWPYWSAVPDLPDKLTRGLCDAATK